MLEMGDGRMMSSNLKMALTNNIVISSSFDSDWLCSNCPLHQDRPALRTGGGGPMQAIILADQNFPAMMPVNTADQCLKIIRVENGSLKDTSDAFCSMVGQRRLPSGSIILALSVAHLACVGLEAYIEDHLEAERGLKKKFGRDTRVGLLPPLLLAGCNNQATVRALYELLAWAEDYF
jgi:hypothetical protein